jgi:hypothetical protein
LYYKELHYFSSSLKVIKVISESMIWTRHVACMEKMNNALKILVENREWKRPLGRPMRRSRGFEIDLWRGKGKDVCRVSVIGAGIQWRVLVNTLTNLRIS